MKSGDQEFVLDSCLVSIIVQSHYPILTEHPLQNCWLWELRTQTRMITFLFTFTLPKPSRYVMEFNVSALWLKAEIWSNGDYKKVNPGILKYVFNVPHGHVPVMRKHTGCIGQVQCYWRSGLYMWKLKGCARVITQITFLTIWQKTPYPPTHYCAVFCYQCRQWKHRKFAGILSISLAASIVFPFSAIAVEE